MGSSVSCLSSHTNELILGLQATSWMNAIWHTHDFWWVWNGFRTRQVYLTIRPRLHAYQDDIQALTSCQSLTKAAENPLRLWPIQQPLSPFAYLWFSVCLLMPMESDDGIGAIAPNAADSDGETTDGHDHELESQFKIQSKCSPPKQHSRFPSPDAEELEAYTEYFNTEVEPGNHLVLDNIPLPSPAPAPTQPAEEAIESTGQIEVSPSNPAASNPRLRPIYKRPPVKRRAPREEDLTAEELALDNSSDDEAQQTTTPAKTALVVNTGSKSKQSTRIQSELEARQSDLSWAKEKYFLERQEQREAESRRIQQELTKDRKAFCEKLVMDGKTPQELEAFLRLVYPPANG
ncbi:uncharacterized protein MELLADRAFT_68841 [Melampsora larici-populina 98AG31]|uniref:No apical meristem-associated C-terminal domain-containing protein n=1 Tax=Melampsora larici-populina (strain 98AG31 / pathotype 3-4-7) TaxID=747676 RepID=F4S8D2_MELLP|nr:uncharacterized protein MELLADRAFT_68841 [Melampsora larici-populina 98AG31]EGF99077.1 hypothetical protein MELLADRAFT_68841 [Melampsora larici-populina 98AG31]